MNNYNSDLDPKKNSTEREYHLRCKILKVKQKAKQGMGALGTNTTETEFERVILLPDLSDSNTVSFFGAWLPDTNKEFHEFAIVLKGPVYGTARCFASRPNEIYAHSPFIGVMSVGAEEELKKHETKTIHIHVLKGSEDSEADSAEDTETTYDIHDARIIDNNESSLVEDNESTNN